ncbi:MAG: cell division protein ZapA [Hyphomicrobiales bacterium]|nr:cell division protein ZapA [Hyphomicrobiales bacterium]
MAHVTINVSGRNYKMACRDGEEKRVLELAAQIDGVVSEIKGGLKLVQEDRLFLMAALMMADQLHETREELTRVSRQLLELRSAAVETAREPRRQQEQLSAVVETLNPKVVRQAS